MPDFVPQVAPVNTSLAETLLNAGNQRAAIQARMFGDVGNTISQIPGQIQGQAAQRQQMQLEQAKAARDQALTQAQLYSLQKEQEGVAALNEAAKPDATGQSKTTAQILDSLKAAGHFDVAAKYAKPLAEADEAGFKLKTQQQTLAKTAADYGATLGANVLDAAKNQDGGLSVAMGAVSHAKEFGMDTSKLEPQIQQLSQMWQQAQGNPQAQAAIADKVRQTLGPQAQQLVAGGSDEWREQNQKLHAPIKMGVEDILVPKDPLTGQPIPGAANTQDALQRIHDVAVAKEGPAAAANVRLAQERLAFEKMKDAREIAGGSDSERAAKEYDKNVKDLQTQITPWVNTATTASNVRQNLDRAAQGDKQAFQAALEGLVGLASPAGGKPRMSLQLIHGQIGEQQLIDKAQNIINTLKTDKSAIVDPEQLKDMYAAVGQYEGTSRNMLGAYRDARGRLSSAGVDDQRKIMDNFTDQQSKIVAPPPSGPVTVNIPGKGMHTFPSQADADAVLKVANGR